MARVPAWLPALVVIVALRLLWPGGYAGGGNDDWHYLKAARCIAEHGWCLPHDHWGTRLPLLYPMAAVLTVVGESRWTVGLVPFLYTAAALVLLTTLVARRFGRAAGALAGLALALTPAFSGPALQPAVDCAELAWLLAALFCGSVAIERDDRRWAALAGAALALAVLTRLTALSVFPLLALGLLFRPPRPWRLAIAVALGLTLPLLLDAVIYALMTNDPAHGWALSLHHTRIASAELPAQVDLGQSALLNLDFIRNWRRSMGIEVHWSVDPWLNLLADPRSGLTLIGAAGLMLANCRRLPPGARVLRYALIAAAIHATLLVYVLAIDPKPRMFLPELTLAAALIGVAATAAWRNHRPALPLVLFALMALRALLLSYDAPDRAAITAAGDRIARADPELAIEAETRTALTLSPAVSHLPASGARTLVLTDQSCRGLAGSMLLREERLVRREPSPIAWLRAHNILLAPATIPSLCVISAGRAPAPPRSAA